jgi:phosphomannomutase
LAADLLAINPALRRPYDLRGVFGDTLTVEDAHAVGLAYAAVARAKSASRIAVSRDGRLSSPALEAALVDGLRRGGMHVFRMPLGPTPLVSFTVARLELDGGVMVTGSHNPADQNGFKLLLGTAPLFGAALGALWDAQPGEVGGGSVEEVDIGSAYLAALAAEIEAAHPGGIVWDSGNGATGEIVERLEHHLPGRHYTLHTEVDGRFPNHHPDPSVAANLDDLADTVRRTGSELGIAFDGDGDRIGVVDSTGAIVWPDQLLLLLARDVLRDRPGSAIVGDVKSSGVLFDGIAAAGGRAVMGPSGYVLVRERMLQTAAPLAGEMSGHVFYGDRWHHADDALYVAMRTIRALAREGLTLRRFRESLPPTFATPEIRLPCADDARADVIRRAAAGLSEASIDRTDGLRVTEPEGWWLLRASGTEAKLTVRCEARDLAAFAFLKMKLRARLRDAGLETGDLL